jgi:phytoene dehydrogenase-like protein
MGVIGGKDEDEERGEVSADEVNSPSAESSSEQFERRKIKARRAKFYSGESWLSISFPSAKDPSFCERHGNITTCVVTLEADEDFVTKFDSKPVLYSSCKKDAESSEAAQRLMERVRKDLVDIYPQLEGRIVHCEMRGPFGKGLSHTPERFAAKGIRADTPFPNLYVSGPDLTVGDSFSGAIVSSWLTANAVMRYATVDHLFLNKNITSDLVRFLETPEYLEEEDVAVNYSPKSVEVAEKIVLEDAQASGEAGESKKKQ